MKNIALLVLLGLSLYGCASAPVEHPQQTDALQGQSPTEQTAQREAVLQNIADNQESLENNCRAHDARACTFLGAYQEHRAGNPQQALEYYTLACGGNDGIGCGSLADLYYKGEAVTPSKSRAFRLYSKACKLNVGEACSNAAEMLEKGEGTAQDLNRALNYYDRSCAFGISPACNRAKSLINDVIQQ